MGEHILSPNMAAVKAEWDSLVVAYKVRPKPYFLTLIIATPFHSRAQGECSLCKNSEQKNCCMFRRPEDKLCLMCLFSMCFFGVLFPWLLPLCYPTPSFNLEGIRGAYLFQKSRFFLICFYYCSPLYPAGSSFPRYQKIVPHIYFEQTPFISDSSTPPTWRVVSHQKLLYSKTFPWFQLTSSYPFQFIISKVCFSCGFMIVPHPSASILTHLDKWHSCYFFSRIAVPTRPCTALPWTCKHLNRRRRLKSTKSEQNVRPHCLTLDLDQPPVGG